MTGNRMGSGDNVWRAGWIAAALLLSGCAGVFEPKTEAAPPEVETAPQPEVSKAATPPQAVASVDHEAPDAFETTDTAAWDGRPSFGRVWVAVPDAIRPERVVIRNPATGQEVQGGMFVRDRVPATGAPIKLSSAAAEALGVDPNSPVELTITALRGGRDGDDAPLLPNRLTARAIEEPALPPYLEEPPSIHAEGVVSHTAEFVEVAQSLTPDGALRVHAGLSAVEIPAEIEQGYTDGLPFYRVFARADTDPLQLFGTLDDLRWANALEGSDDGTLIADVPEPDMMAARISGQTAWLEFGAYAARNEAVAVSQRLARNHVPIEICARADGLLTTYRVFAGPASPPAKDEHGSLLPPSTATLDTASFCVGVAAADAARPAKPPVALRAEALPEVIPAAATDGPGPVRIKVGEATGGLKLSVPNPFSPPIIVPVDGIPVSIPANTPPALLQKIRAALDGL